MIFIRFEVRIDFLFLKLLKNKYKSPRLTMQRSGKCIEKSSNTHILNSALMCFMHLTLLQDVLEFGNHQWLIELSRTVEAVVAVSGIFAIQ